MAHEFSMSDSRGVLFQPLLPCPSTRGGGHGREDPSVWLL
ncbi:hypothetical protein D187_006667 [Cystobacter fuscus DSM 2262]|uniref:Uncharacterized protein n=1 Tax=Cystobacter fuscus (strain ATCC 25194 / DSM 2262 / NBRC 100088 / M29) TaxID=1242864 RepID=S9Q6F5_CYSF2|nr:hypothetical protein D187_006667 [Cystobacter fuscus DSM 2262]